MRRKSLQSKLVAAAVVGLALLALAIGALLRYSAAESIDLAGRQAVRESAEVFASLEQSDADKLAATLLALIDRSDIAERFAARDREGLLRASAPVFNQLRSEQRITHFYFLEPPPSRTCTLRVHKPELFGDRVERTTFSRAIERNGVSWGTELGKTGFALRVVRPFVRGGELVGFVELGEEIDHFLAAMKQSTRNEYAMVLDKRFLDEGAWREMRRVAGVPDDWDNLPTVVLANATSDGVVPRRLDRDLSTLPDEGALLDLLERDGSHYALGVVPIQDAAGHKVGGLVVLHDVTDIRQALDASSRRVLVVLFVLAAGAIALAVVFARSVSRPIEQLTAAVGEMSRGDLTGRISSEGSDEVARLGRGFAQMGDGLRRMVGDLKSTAESLGGQADQLLERARRHSTVATQHSAAIQEASTTISAIAQNSVLARDRAENVIDATTRSEAVSRGGLEALEQVRVGIGKLTAQVEAIGAANETLAARAQRIDEIVESVRDLAEESNVLALNAAIEAARAGEAGVGFAVVARKIRALAEQSRRDALQVRVILAGIKNDARLALETSREGTRRSAEALATTSAAAEAISGLVRVIRESATAGRDIAENTRLQSAGVEQAATAMGEISQATAAALDASREMERASSALAELARTLRSGVDRYRTS